MTKQGKLEGVKSELEGIVTQEDIDAVVEAFKEALRAGDGACAWHRTFDMAPLEEGSSISLWRTTSANLRQCIALLTGKSVFEVIEELSAEEGDDE